MDLTSLSNLLSAAPNLATGGVAQALTQAALQKVTFESSLLPMFTWQPSFNSDGTPAPASTSSWNPLAWLAPKITIFPAFGEPVSFAPFGEPSGNYFLHALGVVALVAAGVAFFFFKAVQLAKYAAIVAAVLVGFGILKNRGLAA